ncbi:MAG TPA: peptide chain release factor N(5)-glutamine methyltransferase [Woeseiaceae bacterium]
MRIDTALARAVADLAEVSDSPRLDAELLLARALDVPRTYLSAHPEDELDDAARRRFLEAIDRRGQGVPLAYITGTREFWSLELMVGPGTLVPRPETELLVEITLDLLPRRGPCRVLDLGTGSGAIALALAHERPGWDITAIDVSAAALAVARENARQLSLPNVTFLEGDWTAPVAGRVFDLVVSNPPYVQSDDPALAALAHEPTLALTPGEDALRAIRILARECLALLRPGGPLLLEHGVGQERDVAGILAYHGWTGIESFDDLTGRPRAVLARRGTLGHDVPPTREGST